MCNTCIPIFVGGASPVSEIFLFLNLTIFPFLTMDYRIPGNFRGAKFSRISRFLLFREIIAMPHPLILHTWIIRENIFREFLFRENLAPRKFPGIRYSPW